MKIGEPAIVERAAQPYAALRRAGEYSVRQGHRHEDHGAAVRRRSKRREFKALGAVIFKYNIVKMPELEIEFGFEVDNAGGDGQASC